MDNACIGICIGIHKASEATEESEGFRGALPVIRATIMDNACIGICIMIHKASEATEESEGFRGALPVNIEKN